MSTGQVLPHTQSITAAPILSIREVPQSSGASPPTEVSPSESPTTSREKTSCANSPAAVGKTVPKAGAIRRILPKTVSPRAFSANSHSNIVLPQTRAISPSVVVNLADMMDSKTFDLDDLAYSTYFQDPGMEGAVPFDPQGFDYEPDDLLTPAQHSPQSPAQQDENLDADALFSDSFLLNNEEEVAAAAAGAPTETNSKTPPPPAHIGRITRRKSAARRIPNSSVVQRTPGANGVCSPYLT
ncbi:unnamed protein product [Dibothriocephalus latus]|uniref:Uncharacterized protein n=1 Tax=Dibothriocephalus latus TaxID=60516 RepID=A0A3P7P5X8_DIBLA|nr:unnamed protein product [Dibothriocephalus latus]